MAVTDQEALSRAHMAQQVRESATVQVALSRLWDRTLDPSDISGSIIRFQVLAAPYIGAGRTISERTAQAYFDELKRLAGLGLAPGMPRAPIPTSRIAGSLAASTAKSVTRAQALAAAGFPVAAALASAKSNMLGSAKRQMLNAGRGRLMELSRADDDVVKVARVSDGRPCAFCAMLVSRGPVYTESTGRFRAHDRCGCSARPVLRNDPTGGWSDDARALRSLWEDTAGKPGEFRRALADPSATYDLTA